MPAPIGTHDVKGYIVTLGLLPLDSGAGQNGYCLIERQVPNWTIVVGHDGSVVRSKTNQTHTKVTLTLHMTAPAAKILDGMVIADEGPINGAAVMPFVMKAIFGTFSLTDGAAFVEGPPASRDIQQQAQDIQYVIWLPNPDREE